MENMENLEVVETSENVEQTTEQTQQEEKTFTQKEVDEIVGKRVARKEARIRKEYDRKYGELEEVLKAGTGKQNVEEMTDAFRGFYQQKGINIPKKAAYSEQDIEVLARAEAEDIIRAGYDDVVEEVDRLTEIGAANMTAKERAVFKALAEHRQSAERSKELSSLGVTEDIYNSPEFKAFEKKFTPDIPITDIYDIYRKMQPKKEIKNMGSMKQSPVTGAKDYYTPEEIERLTEDDLDDPKVWEAVRRSMTGR